MNRIKASAYRRDPTVDGMDSIVMDPTVEVGMTGTVTIEQDIPVWPFWGETQSQAERRVARERIRERKASRQRKAKARRQATRRKP